MSVAAWAASLRGLESPPSSSPGDWNRPALDVRQTVWDMREPTPFFLIDGTVDLDNRFFVGPNGYFHDFAITLALSSPDIPHPIDWQTEGPTARNPHSFMRLDAGGGRITIDEHFASVRWEICMPTGTKWFPKPGEARSFVLRVKAFAVADASGSMVTETNETSFVVMNRCGMGTIVNQRRNSSWQL